MMIRMFLKILRGEIPCTKIDETIIVLFCRCKPTGPSACSGHSKRAMLIGTILPLRAKKSQFARAIRRVFKKLALSIVLSVISNIDTWYQEVPHLHACIGWWPDWPAYFK